MCYLKSSPGAPVPQIREGMHRMEVCQITQCRVSSLSNFITLSFFSPFRQLLLLYPLSNFVSFFLQQLFCVSFSLSAWHLVLRAGWPGWL